MAIGTVVMRNKQYLAAVRPLDGALAMSTMRFADEVVPRSEVEGCREPGAKPDAKALQDGDARSIDSSPDVEAGAVPRHVRRGAAQRIDREGQGQGRRRGGDRPRSRKARRCSI